MDTPQPDRAAEAAIDPAAERGAVDLGPLGSMLFHALRRAQAAVLDDLQAALAAEDIRPQWFAVLVVIARNPGLRQSQLGFALDILRTNLVPLLDALGARGLAERRAVPGDRRAHGLFLTRLGSETLARLEARAAAHEARLAARLGTAGRGQLHAMLHRLADPAPNPDRD